jgi:hypothetical protein
MVVDVNNMFFGQRDSKEVKIYVAMERGKNEV